MTRSKIRQRFETLREDIQAVPQPGKGLHFEIRNDSEDIHLCIEYNDLFMYGFSVILYKNQRKWTVEAEPGHEFAPHEYKLALRIFKLVGKFQELLA